MINSIELQKLRNAEFIQFSRNFSTLISQKDPQALNVKPQFDAFTLKLTQLEDLFKSPLGSAVTPEIEQLDYRRDEAISGLTAIVNAFTHHFSPEMREAAILLQSNLKLYSTGIARENYQAETAIINNIIIDWTTKPELQNAVDMLGLLEWTLELGTSNTLFDDKLIVRTQESASAPTETLRSTRQEVMTSFYELKKCLEVFALINHSVVFDSVISEVNELINQYRTLIRSRKTTKTTEPSNN